MSAGDGDNALDALFLPLISGEIGVRAGGAALFLRARAGAWLNAWSGGRSLVCSQTSKPLADALVYADARIESPHDAQRFALVLALPPRQRDEARALLARALRRVEVGGIVVACQSNNEGARSGEADLARLAGSVQSLSKHKCRVFWATRSAGTDESLIDEWLALDALQTIADGRYVSRPGLFAWDRIDPASALLAAHLPNTLAGAVADLGAGYGYLASEVVRRCTAVVSMDLYEAEQRALEPARINLDAAQRDVGHELAVEIHWHDVTGGLPKRYDAIVSNPPFHQGRADQPELGQAFIAAAANALNPGGELWLVANRHLPYEASLATRFAQVRLVADEKGFKVIHAQGPRR
jgi:16S rRNA (guanine1207-N2)-methyltransferase